MPHGSLREQVLAGLHPNPLDSSSNEPRPRPKGVRTETRRAVGPLRHQPPAAAARPAHPFPVFPLVLHSATRPAGIRTLSKTIALFGGRCERPSCLFACRTLSHSAVTGGHHEEVDSIRPPYFSVPLAAQRWLRMTGACYARVALAPAPSAARERGTTPHFGMRPPSACTRFSYQASQLTMNAGERPGCTLQNPCAQLWCYFALCHFYRRCWASGQWEERCQHAVLPWPEDTRVSGAVS